MTSTAFSSIFPEGNILPFPTLPLLQSYAEDISKSVNNPTLQKTQVDFLMMNIVAILDALKVTDKANAVLTSELSSLKEIQAELEIRCNQTHDNNRWLNERYSEARKVNFDLTAAKKQLESKLFVSSRKEKYLLERISWMEQAIRKLSGLIVKKRIGSYKLIELWIYQELSKSFDEISEDFKHDNCDESREQAQDMINTARKPGEKSNDEAVAIGPVGDPGSSFPTEKLWDDMFSNPVGSERDASVTESDDAVSKAASDLSMFTDIITYRMIQNKGSPSLVATPKETGAVEAEAQYYQVVTNTTDTYPVENNVPVKAVATNGIARNVKPDAKLAKPNTMPSKPISNIYQTGHADKDMTSKDSVVRTRQSSGKRRYFLPINRLQQPPNAESPQEAQTPQSINTCEDSTRYVDITCSSGNGYLAYADSINPQVVVADPDEVAGDWNDVPVPVELRRIKATEKVLKTFERNVLIVGLPPTITVEMLATFVRGGKIENICIINEGKKGGIQSALVSFFSRRAARNFQRWMEESPRLVVDRHLPRSSLMLAVPPPIIPSGGCSRVMIVKNVPKEVKTDEAFWNLIFKTAERHHCKISVQETRIWPVASSEEERRFSGAVIFDSYHMGCEMHKILKQRLKLEVKWGHDRCEDPLVQEKLYKFVEYKKKQYDDESD